MADAEVVNGRKNFVILILKEKLDDSKLSKEMKIFLQTYTCIDGTKNTEKISDKLR